MYPNDFAQRYGRRGGQSNMGPNAYGGEQDYPRDRFDLGGMEPGYGAPGGARGWNQRESGYAEDGFDRRGRSAYSQELGRGRQEPYGGSNPAGQGRTGYGSDREYGYPGGYSSHQGGDPAAGRGIASRWGGYPNEQTNGGDFAPDFEAGRYGSGRYAGGAGSSYSGYGSGEYQSGGGRSGGQGMMGGEYGGGSQGWSGPGAQSGSGYGGSGRYGGAASNLDRKNRKGPKGYERSDDRVREEIIDQLLTNAHVNLEDVSIDVSNGEVTLSGTVEDRRSRYDIEAIADGVWGVKDINNNLKVKNSREHARGGSKSDSSMDAGSDGGSSYSSSASRSGQGVGSGSSVGSGSASSGTKIR